MLSSSETSEVHVGISVENRRSHASGPQSPRLRIESGRPEAGANLLLSSASVESGHLYSCPHCHMLQLQKWHSSRTSPDVATNSTAEDIGMSDYYRIGPRCPVSDLFTDPSGLRYVASAVLAGHTWFRHFEEQGRSTGSSPYSLLHCPLPSYVGRASDILSIRTTAIIIHPTG